MSNFKFAWFSDTHVGFRQYGLQRREEDFRRAFLDAIRLTIDTGCEFGIHSGDIIHNNRPSAATIATLQEGHALLKDAGIPLLVVSGNHDFSEPHWLETVDPGGTHPDTGGLVLFDNQRWTPESQPGFVVFGLPWMPREQFLEQCKGRDQRADVVIWHGALQEFIGFPQASALRVEELPLMGGVQLWAAGDIHVNKVKKYGNTWVGYPGSTELNSATEEDVKVVKIVDVVDGKIVKFTDWPIATRPVIRITVGQECDIAHHIDELRKHAAGVYKSPIVFIEYPQDIGCNVLERFKAALNPDEFVLRDEPDPVSRDESGDYTQIALQTITPADMLETMLPQDNPILPVARKIIDPTNRAEDAIDQFIDAACA